METAVSIPDPVFEEAEKLAKRLSKSRSQLYTEALTDYVARRSPDAVTERLNDVWDSLSEHEDRFVTETSNSVLKKVEW